MTFSTIVPNASQSPGLFPAQNNTNFTRLKSIIDADHLFTDTSATNQGAHRQVTFINRAVPVGLPIGTNAILYTANDSGGIPQLNFYNGTNYQLTNPELLFPIRAADVQSMNSGLTLDVLNVAYDFIGTGTVSYFDGTLRGRSYVITRIGANTDITEYKTFGSPGNVSLAFSGTVLIVGNGSGSTKSVNWSVIVNRIS